MPGHASSYSLASINQQEFHPVACSLLPHIFDEADKVSPVGTIVVFFQMSFEPAMRVCGVDKVQLAPGKRPLWTDSGIQGTWLHASDKPGMDGRISWAIAGVTGKGCGGRQRGEEGRLEHGGAGQRWLAMAAKAGVKPI